jgi:hypothetical protein
MSFGPRIYTRNPSEFPRMTKQDTSTERQADPAGRADAIESSSPEGRPAHPNVGPAGITLLALLPFVIIALAAVALALFIDIAIGVAVGLLGTIIFALNPQLWAGIFRAQERNRI